MKKLKLQMLGLLLIGITGCGSNNSSIVRNKETSPLEDHVANMYHMGDQMFSRRYHANEQGKALTDKDVSRAIVGGSYHFHTPSVTPYEMQWRLTGYGDFVEDLNGIPFRLPVSFLRADSDKPIDQPFVRSVADEFKSITSAIIPKSSVQALVSQGYKKFKKVRESEPAEDGYNWTVYSQIMKCDTLNRTKGQYALRIDFWESISDGSTITMYFIFLPEGCDVDFSKVTGGGFQY